jgi:hypothetical protein
MRYVIRSRSQHIESSNNGQDETWPTCSNCQKNGKCCPGPPARHTFRDLGPRLASDAAILIVDTEPALSGRHDSEITKQATDKEQTSMVDN